MHVAVSVKSVLCPSPSSNSVSLHLLLADHHLTGAAHLTQRLTVELDARQPAENVLEPIAEPKQQENLTLFLFPTPHTVINFFGVMSGFTRLVMRTKYVYHGLISRYVNFHNNWTT